LVALNGDVNFIGKQALQEIHHKRHSRKQVGLELLGDPLLGPNTNFWPIKKDGKDIWERLPQLFFSTTEKKYCFGNGGDKSHNIRFGVDICTDFGILKGLL
jgi:hypothetical protein